MNKMPSTSFVNLEKRLQNAWRQKNLAERLMVLRLMTAQFFLVLFLVFLVGRFLPDHVVHAFSFYFMILLLVIFGICFPVLKYRRFVIGTPVPPVMKIAQAVSETRSAIEKSYGVLLQSAIEFETEDIPGDQNMKQKTIDAATAGATNDVLKIYDKHLADQTWICWSLFMLIYLCWGLFHDISMKAFISDAFSFPKPRETPEVSVESVPVRQGKDVANVTSSIGYKGSLEVVPPEYCGIEAWTCPLQDFQIMENSRVTFSVSPRFALKSCTLMLGNKELKMSRKGSTYTKTMQIRSDIGHYAFKLMDHRGNELHPRKVFSLEVITDNEPKLDFYLDAQRYCSPTSTIGWAMYVVDDYGIRKIKQNLRLYRTENDERETIYRDYDTYEINGQITASITGRIDVSTMQAEIGDSLSISVTIEDDSQRDENDDSGKTFHVFKLTVVDPDDEKLKEAVDARRRSRLFRFPDEEIHRLNARRKQKFDPEYTGAVMKYYKSITQ